jgi:hypothetical protein
MDEDQFNALEAWIMAAARAMVERSEDAQDQLDDRRMEARLLLVEEEIELPTYGEVTGFHG